MYDLKVKAKSEPSGRPMKESIMPPNLHDKIESHPKTRSCDKLTPTGRASVTNMLPQDIRPTEIEIIAPLHERATVPRNERELIMQYVTEKRIRAAIIDQFVSVFNCPPVKGWNNIMKYVRRNLKLCGNKYNKIIKRTFQSVVMQLTRCDNISPDRKKRRITQKNMIDPNSFDAQFIADLIESGYSYQKTTISLNMKKEEMHLPYVTFSTVYGIAKRLNPVR